jgi:hypothetical protein
LRVAAGNGEARSETKNNADDESDEESPDEGSTIDANGVEKRKSDGALVREIRHDSEGESYAEDGTDGGEDERLGDELASEATAAGAERGAHGKFLGAGGDAGEKKIGEIDADD